MVILPKGAFMRRILLSLITLSTVVSIPSSRAENIATVRVPMCLQFPDSQKYVPCTGVVPVDVTTGNAPLEFQTSTNPTTVPTTNGIIANRFGGGNSSVATFQYQMAGTLLTGGTAGASGFIATNGEGATVLVQSVLAPNQCIGVSIGGNGGGLSAAARISVTFTWYEENTN